MCWRQTCIFRDLALRMYVIQVIQLTFLRFSSNVEANFAHLFLAL